ncbi:MAG: PKD domain-containing protein, partial [Bacteriovoracaceae bacterium]|nr:PKD domain-containing protein [Bacteriovoracaceae bacterium]
ALLQPSGFKKPVGSAMERGKSPCLYEYYPCISYMRDEPEDQFDVGKSAHAPDMLDDYAGWILYIVKRTYEKPAYPAPPEPPVYIAPKIDYFSTGNIFFYAETHVTFHWRGNKPSLYYSTSVSRAGQVDKWTDWKKGYFSDSVMLGSPGTYTVKVKVKDDKGASLKIKTINVRARPPQISFKPVSPNIIFVGEKVSIDWMTDWNKNEFKYVLAIPNGDRIDGPAWSTNKHVEYQLDEIGNYLFSVEAKGKFNAKRRAGLPISVIDYIFSDEVIACGICLAEHSCSFTVAQLVKGPEETGDNTYIVKPTNNAALWESGVDMQTHFAIKKSFPVTLQTRSKLKVGQSVFWNGGNPPEAVGMRRRYMLGKILSLDKINKGMVTVRPYHGFVDFIEENKSVDVYYHNLRTFDETNLKNFKDTRPYCNGRWGVPKIEITRQRMVGPHGGTFSNLHPDQEGTFVWRSNVAGYYLKYAIKSKDGNPNNLKWSEWTKNLSGIKKSFKKLGEYEFLIMTKNHLGTISKEPVVIKFSVIKEK